MPALQMKARMYIQPDVVLIDSTPETAVVERREGIDLRTGAILATVSDRSSHVGGDEVGT